MKLLKTQPIAILIMLAVVVLSAFIGCRRSLLAEMEAVNDFFLNGNSDEYSIQSDLEYINATANNFKTVATRYIQADDALIVELVNARTKLSNAETIHEKYIAGEELLSAVDLIYTSLDPSKMNTTDLSFRESLYDDIVSAVMRIQKNSYNEIAQEFNAVLDSFPTRYFADMLGIEAVQLFN